MRKKKIDEAQEKPTKAKNEFQSVRAMVVPEPEQLTETKKKQKKPKQKRQWLRKNLIRQLKR